MFMPVSGVLYNITVGCENNTCVKGESANWTIAIENKGDEDIELVDIRLIDSRDNSTFLFYPTEEKINTFNLDHKEHILIIPNKKKTISVEKAVPTPENNAFFSFYACFNTTIRRDDTDLIVEKIYGIEKCFNQLFIINVNDCIADSQCHSNQTCKSKSCINIRCNGCQYISNHQCMDYNCCEHSACSKNQYCFNHSCTSLGCNATQYTFNHTCTELNCFENQSFFNHSCIDLTCTDIEISKNHTCQRIFCAENEFLVNKSCKKLPCKETQSYFNHSCIELHCKSGEIAFNHTCFTPDCNGLQNFINGSCRYDLLAIISVSMEIVSFGIIILVLYLLFSKIRKLKLNQLNNVANKKTKNIEKEVKK